MREPILEVGGLTLSIGGVELLHNLTFSAPAGQITCLVGESGSGKSLTVSALLGLLPEGAELAPESRITFRGESIFSIFQDPINAFNPSVRVGRQLYQMARGYRKVERRAFQRDIAAVMDRLRLDRPEAVLKKYPFELSGGMLQRLMIACAIYVAPSLIIADEPTTALDVTIQHQILKQMRSLQEEYGTSIIFITHDLGVVAELCDRVVVLYGGLVMEEAEINDLFENPLHPYTMGLLASIPGLTKDKSERLQSIPGSPPDMTKPPKGCPFASRCQFARNICAAECPPFVQVGSRQARCWLLQPDAPAEGNPLHEKLAEAERKAH